MSTKHFQLIIDALEVGIEGYLESGEAGEQVTLDKPIIFDGLQPPVSLRAVVVIDGDPYEVTIKAAEPGEAHEPEVRHD